MNRAAGTSARNTRPKTTTPSATIRISATSRPGNTPGLINLPCGKPNRWNSRKSILPRGVTNNERDAQSHTQDLASTDCVVRGRIQDLQGLRDFDRNVVSRNA